MNGADGKETRRKEGGLFVTIRSVSAMRWRRTGRSEVGRKGGQNGLSCAIAEEQLSRITSKWEVFFEQLSICLNYLLETFVSGHGALSRQKMDPKSVGVS